MIEQTSVAKCGKGNPVCIMDLMSLAHFPLKRFIATLLSASFLWVFVSCVGVCAKELEEHAWQNVPTSTAMASGKGCIGSGLECVNCPFAAFLKATIPERPALHSDFQPSSIIQPLAF